MHRFYNSSDCFLGHQWYVLTVEHETRRSRRFLAPTGSGKTVLFELAIINMLTEAQETGQTVKCIYVAPTKVCSLQSLQLARLTFLF